VNPTCKQCGTREVEDARAQYATPVCFACLPPPRPLNTSWSLSPEWLAAAAEILGHVRLTPDVLLDLVRDLHDDRDHWRQRAESAEYALAPYLDKDGKIAFDPQSESIRRRPDQEPR